MLPMGTFKNPSAFLASCAVAISVIIQQTTPTDNPMITLRILDILIPLCKNQKILQNPIIRPFKNFNDYYVKTARGDPYEKNRLTGPLGWIQRVMPGLTNLSRTG